VYRRQQHHAEHELTNWGEIWNEKSLGQVVRPLSAHLKDRGMDDTAIKSRVSVCALNMAEKISQQIQGDAK
jgi:hypothetical protein